MIEIEYKYLPPTGPDSIESKDKLDVFLLNLPHLFYMGYIPPLKIINKFLFEGVDDAGMSGGAEWTPFSIDEKDYNEIITSFKSKKYNDSEPYNFSLIGEEINSKNEWHVKVMERRQGIPFDRHLELLEREQELRLKSKEAYEKGNKELGEQLHIECYQSANELDDFCDDYFH